MARGWADAAIAAGAHDHVMLERVRRAALQDVSLAVRGCDRVLDLSVERRCGAVRPSGAVERSVAEDVADRLLSNVGGPEPRMDVDRRESPRVREVVGRLAAANRPADAVLAEVAPGFAVGGDRDDASVLDVVRDRAEAVTEVMLDPTRIPGRRRPGGTWSAPAPGGPASRGRRPAGERRAPYRAVRQSGVRIRVGWRTGRWSRIGSRRWSWCGAGSIAFAGWAVRSVMSPAGLPGMPLTALVVVPPVYVGAVHAVPVWSSGVVAPVVGLGCLVIGSTNQLLLSVGAVVLLMAVADVGSSAAASHAAGPRTERFRDVAAVAGHRRFGRTAVERGESGGRARRCTVPEPGGLVRNDVWRRTPARTIGRVACTFTSPDPTVNAPFASCFPRTLAARWRWR